MNLGGAPKGNTNASKPRQWTAAIHRALDKRSLGERKEALDELAEKLLANCDQGDMTALKELGDRLEGKPKQQQVLTGEDDGPIKVETKLSANESARRIALMLMRATEDQE